MGFSWKISWIFNGFSWDVCGIFQEMKCMNIWTKQWFTSMGVSELDIDLPWIQSCASSIQSWGNFLEPDDHPSIKCWLENQLDDDVQIFAQKKTWLEKIAFQTFHDQQKKTGILWSCQGCNKKCCEISHPSIEDTWDNLFFVAAGGIFAEAKSGVARGTWVSWVVLVLSLEDDGKIRPKMGAEDLWEGRTYTIGGVLAVQEQCVCWVFLCLIFHMAWTWNALTLCNLCQMLYICIQIIYIYIYRVLCIFVSMISVQCFFRCMMYGSMIYVHMHMSTIDFSQLPSQLRYWVRKRPSTPWRPTKTLGLIDISDISPSWICPLEMDCKIWEPQPTLLAGHVKVFLQARIAAATA